MRILSATMGGSALRSVYWQTAMFFTNLPEHQHVIRHALLRGASLAYLLFGLTGLLLTFPYGGWTTIFLVTLFLLGALLFWQCSRWVAHGQRVRLAVRLSAGCLLFITSVFALTAPREFPAAGATVFVLVLLFSSLTDSKRGAWLFCGLCILCHVTSVWARAWLFGIDFGDDPEFLLMVYFFTPLLFLLFTFIATDLSVYLRSTLQTSAGLQRDLHSRTLEYQKLLETMNEGFVIINKDDIFEFVNNRFCEMVGLPADQVIGRRYTELAEFDEANQMILREQRALREQKLRSSYELQATRSDGLRATLLISAIPNLDADGHYCGTSCVVTDITERKLAEEALIAERTLLSQRVKERTASLQAANEALARELAERQQAEAEYRLLFNHVPLGLYRASLDGRLLRANPALVRLHGFASEAEMLTTFHSGQRDWYVDPARRTEFRRLLHEQGSVANFESEVLQHQTDKQIWISESAVIVCDPTGTPLYYQGTVEDITARKEVELQQERLIAELASVAQMKDKFLANISHELRTPLNGILNLTELLREQIYGALNDRQQQALATIEESSQHLLSLINDILDLAKVEAGKTELVLAPVALNDLCQASIRFIQPAAQKKKLRLYFTHDPAVHMLLADEMRLKQILINLLGNAVKFTPDYGAIGLEVIGRPGDEAAVDIVVWDTGPGIPAQAHEAIFRPFVQVDSRLARQHEGSGLGLALVRRMVGLHGGTVTLESEVERGSRFTVTLPWREPASPGQQFENRKGASSRPHRPAPVKKRPAGPLVLLVSQDAATHQMIGDYLRFKGYEVTVVATVEEMVASVPGHTPAAVILDLQPLLEEDERPASLLRTAPHLSTVPIISLTANEGYKPAATGCADAYLRKPIRLQELAQIIEATVTANGSPQATLQTL
ncbi:MAG: hypothetical protein DCC55_03975 [Chloroflexi bacterium]|nr:MAG: hypothetical protein DCC55_03975 [Chloroflexota bacterium]